MAVRYVDSLYQCTEWDINLVTDFVFQIRSLTDDFQSLYVQKEEDFLYSKKINNFF